MSDHDARLALEVRKLELEVDLLRRPFKTPSVIAALTTTSFVAVISLAGLAIQATHSQRQYELAQIKAEQLKLDAAKLRAERENLEVAVSSASRELAKAKADLEKAQRGVDSATAKITNLRNLQESLRLTIEVLESSLAPPPAKAVAPPPPAKPKDCSTVAGNII